MWDLVFSLISFLLELPKLFREFQQKRTEGKLVEAEAKLHRLEVKDAVRKKQEQLDRERSEDIETVKDEDIDDHFSRGSF